MGINNELYALSGDLQEGGQIPLYTADIGDVGAKCKGLLLRRDEVGTFLDPREISIELHEGKYFAEAMSAPGSNQSTYPYMLLREVGQVTRTTGEFMGQAADDVASAPIIGATKWDLMKVDQRPGHYYVSMRRDDGKSVPLLGPFSRHINALLRVRAAKNHVLGTIEGATWFTFGTVRMDDADKQLSAPAGKLNSTLLSETERHSLLSLLTPDANYVKIYGTMSVAMREAYDNLVALGINKHYFTPKGAREYADDSMRGTLSKSQIEDGSSDLLEASNTLRGEFLKMEAVINGLVGELSAQIAKMNESIPDPDFHHKPLPDYLMLEANLDVLVVRSKDNRASCRVLIRQVDQHEGEARYVAAQHDEGKETSSKSRPCPLVEAVCWASNVLHDHGDSWKPESQAGHETPSFRMK